MRSYDFLTVDVFTDRRFAGNPLMVMPDARGLLAEEMQAITREFGYSESTFVLPPEDPAHTARVRIFTPTTEIPFAGHPNVGTAFALAQEGAVFGRAVGDRMRFEEQAGLVEVTLRRGNDGAVAGASIVAPAPFASHPGPSPALLAEALGVPTTAILTAAHPPVVASVGLPFVIAELSDHAALAAAQGDRGRFLEAERRFPTRSAQFSTFLYVRDPALPGRVRARMFAPLDDVPEDPATGSASGALAALLAALAPERDFVLELVIDQGVEMGRPSRLDLQAVKRDGAVTQVTIAGACIAMLRGRLDLPALTGE